MTRKTSAVARTGRGSKPRVNVPERRAEYLRIASRVFLEKGLGAATMQDVADAAGAPKVLIYRIFPSKQALLDAILSHVIDAINTVYAEPNWVYGGRAQDIARAAGQCPEPFLLVFRYSQAGVEPRDWAEAVTKTLSSYTLTRWFAPGPDAPAGAAERAEYASRLNVGPLLETLIRWIENRDGLSESARLRWWGRIAREYHLASREAFQLGTVPQIYRDPD